MNVSIIAVIDDQTVMEPKMKCAIQLKCCLPISITTAQETGSAQTNAIQSGGIGSTTILEMKHRVAKNHVEAAPVMHDQMRYIWRCFFASSL